MQSDIELARTASARQSRRDGIVFFDSQQVAKPPRRKWIAIAGIVLVVAALVAIGVWRFVPGHG